MKAKFCVRKRTLLLIAGIVWMIAGFNVARLGVMSYMNVVQNGTHFDIKLLLFFCFITLYKVTALVTLSEFWHFRRNIYFNF